MYYNNIPVLTYNIHFPSFTTTCNNVASQRINDYYIAASKKTEIYCRTVLYPQAAEAARYIQTNIPPFNSYEFLSTYNITYNSNCITSLYIDQYTYAGGAHGATVRGSDTWNFYTGCQVALVDFLPYDSDIPNQIFPKIEQQIATRLKVTPSSYFDDYQSLLRKHFHPDNFYITPNASVIYYQQYDIAPYSTGIPTFLI